MDEAKIIDENFFVIDSEHLDDVKSKLYGFALHEGRIIQDNDVKIGMKSCGGGYICMGKI